MEKLKVRIEESTDQVSRFENIAFYILMGVAFLLPIFFIPSQAFQFQFSKAVFVSLAVLVSFAFWLVARLKDGRYPLPNNSVFWVSALVLAVTLVSALMSPAVRTSFIGQGFESGTWAQTAVMLVMLFLFANIFRPKERVFYLYLALFASSLLIVLFHALRFAFGAEFLSFGLFNDITSNLIGKWNDLGIFFGLVALLSLITVELMRVNKIFKILLWFIFALSLVSLTIVNFPTLWYALAFFGILYFVYAYAYKRFFVSDNTESSTSFDGAAVTSSGRLKKISRGSIAAILLIVLSAVFLIDNYRTDRPLATKINEKLNISNIEVRPNWGSTMDVAMNVLKKEPLFGSGLNRFSSEWLLNKPDGINEGIFWNTDFSAGIGILPTYLVTGGILGFLSWLLLIASLLYLGLRYLLTPVVDKLLRYLSVSSFFAAAFLWTFFIFYIPSTAILTLMFLFSGVFVASLYNERLLKPKTIAFSEEPKAGFVSVFVLTIILVGAATLGYVSGQKFIASAYFQKALMAANQNGDVAGAEKYALRATKVSKNDLYDRFLVEVYLVKLNDLLTNTPASANADEVRSQFQSLLGDALTYAREAVDIDNTNYQNWLSLGRIYESVVSLDIEGAYESASDAYNSALALNPESPQIHLVRARLEFAKEDTSAARAEIDKALALKANYTEAIFLLSQIQVSEGNVREAIKSAESAATLSPNDATVFFQLGLLKYNNRDNRGAVTALERAVALSPDYSNAKYFLGLAYERLNRITDAIAQFKSIMQLNPGNTEVPRIIENLEAGRDPFASIAPPAEQPEDRDTLPVEEEGIQPEE